MSIYEYEPYMYALDLINKTREYLDYLENHINNIKVAWAVIKDRCKDMEFIVNKHMYRHLESEIGLHDTSKLYEREFVQYRAFFYPSPPFDFNRNINLAWEHHKKCNPHHWENWTKKDMLYLNEWKVHCVHMIIDWMAMSYVLGGSAKEYYEKNKDKIQLPDFSIIFMYEIFERIK